MSHLPARARHISHLVSLAALVSSLTTEAAAAPLTIRVKGRSSIDVHSRSEDAEVTLSGTLADDDGLALAGQAITLSVRARGAAQTIPFQNAHTCLGTPKELSGDSLPLVTDARGEFCVRGVLPRDRATAIFAWSGSELVDATNTTIELDLSRQLPRLRFEDAPAVSNIDDPIELSLAIDTDGHGVAGATLTLADEQDRPLGSWITGSGGRVRVLLLAGSYGTEGPGEIRASFAGNAIAAPANTTLRLERHARVRLTPRPLNAGDPEDGIDTAIAVTTSKGVVRSGTVRASIGGTTVGAAPVQNGEARLHLLFTTEQTGEIGVTLSYLPDAPWLEAGEEVDLRVPLRKRFPWRQAVVITSGLAVAVWFALSRKRSVGAVFIPDARPPEAAVISVGTVAPKEPIWSGTVVDAHDLTPLGDARIRIERVGFEGRHVVAATSSRDDGTFDLDATHSPPLANDELVIDAVAHAELRRALPQGGSLRIALVTRRRKLLERFVSWAKAHGWAGRGKEPTPGDVRDRSRDPAMRAWAELVAHAAFDHAGVDAAREVEVERAAPTPLATPEDAKAAKTIRNSDKSPG